MSSQTTTSPATTDAYFDDLLSALKAIRDYTESLDYEDGDLIGRVQAQEQALDAIRDIAYFRIHELESRIGASIVRNETSKGDADSRATQCARTSRRPGFVKSLPFRSQDRHDREANLDVCLWRFDENACEMRDAGNCDPSDGLFYGSHEDQATKFCPRHFYESHFGPNAPYTLISTADRSGQDSSSDSESAARRPDIHHPQFQRLQKAFALIHEVIEKWDENEVASYPDYLPSFDEYVSDIEVAVFEIEWK